MLILFIIKITLLRISCSYLWMILSTICSWHRMTGRFMYWMFLGRFMLSQKKFHYHECSSTIAKGGASYLNTAASCNEESWRAFLFFIIAPLWKRSLFHVLMVTILAFKFVLYSRHFKRHDLSKLLFLWLTLWWLIPFIVRRKMFPNHFDHDSISLTDRYRTSRKCLAESSSFSLILPHLLELSDCLRYFLTGYEAWNGTLGHSNYL